MKQTSYSGSVDRTIALRTTPRRIAMILFGVFWTLNKEMGDNLLNSLRKVFNRTSLLRADRKKGREDMRYLIDHQQKTIHESRYMESRCHVNDSSPENKEVVESRSYIESLKTQHDYIPCPYCYEVPLLID